MVAVLTGALLLALASSSFPIFVSATESSSLTEAVAGTSNYGAGVTVVQDTGLTPRPREKRMGAVRFDERDRILRERFAGVPHLGTRVFTILGPVVLAPNQKGGLPLPVRLLAKTGWESHVEKVSGGGEGVWLADGVAASLGIEAGDDIDLAEGSRKGRVHVAGTYKALVKYLSPQPYWLSLNTEIYPARQGFTDPPAFVMMDSNELDQVSHELGHDHVQFTWEFPLAEESITLPQADQVFSRFRAFQQEFLDPNSELASKFACVTCRKFACGNCQLGIGRYFSSLDVAIGEARRNVAAIRGPVNLLSVAGIIVALTVIASAGVFTMTRRRTEYALLFARGTSALTVWAKSALESLLPVALGTALGFAAAVGIIELIGPSGSVDKTAMWEGVRVALVGLPVAVLLLGLASAVSYLRQSESATARFRRLSKFPWQIPVLILAAFFLSKVLNGGALVEESGQSVSRPSVYLLLFPIFFIGGVAGLGARLLQVPLRALVRGSSGSRPAPYLALHRLAGTKKLAVLLVTAAALSLGMLVYAQTVVASLTTTIDAKSTLFVGSDVQAQASFNQEPPENFPYPITKVTKILDDATLQPSSPRNLSKRSRMN
jgi:putative ABC transport system permease protein